MSKTTPTPTAPTPTTQTRKANPMTTQPTALEIVRNIENGNRAQAAAQITGHPESARMAIAVLSTLANDLLWSRDYDADAWHDAAATVVRTLNAGEPL
jgi:hypothetical protein